MYWVPFQLLFTTTNSRLSFNCFILYLHFLFVFFSQGTLCACAACNGNKTSLVDRMTIFVHVLVQSTIQNNLQMINLSISFYSEANTIDRLTEFVRNVNYFFFVNSMLRSIYIVQAFSQYATVHVYRSRNRGSKKMIIKAENKYDSKWHFSCIRCPLQFDRFICQMCLLQRSRLIVNLKLLHSQLYGIVYFPKRISSICYWLGFCVHILRTHTKHFSI